MGLEGEEVYTGWAYANGDNFYSESWSIDMPPSDAFVKTSLCDVVGLLKDAAVEIGILNIRYLLPDDSNGRANLDGIDWPNTIKAWSSPKMTHFTFAVRFAKKLGHSVENLKILRAPNTINPFKNNLINFYSL